jgi:hypothetical protein
MLRIDELQRNEFIYGGFADSIFTVEEKEWFLSNYALAFQTEVGPPIDWFVVFRKRK